jgi:4-aminobutyrate aminotransferase-like enzyme
MPAERPPSRLFYQTRRRRPLKDQAKGVYIWDVDGNRYLDGSSGAMVCNIGHANPRVIEAMRRQMERGAFGYRLHFETEASEKTGRKTAALTPRASTACSSSPAAPRRWKARSSSPGNTRWRAARRSAGR